MFRTSADTYKYTSLYIYSLSRVNIAVLYHYFGGLQMSGAPNLEVPWLDIARLQDETAELNQRIQQVTSPVSVMPLDLLMNLMLSYSFSFPMEHPLQKGTYLFHCVGFLDRKSKCSMEG